MQTTLLIQEVVEVGINSEEDLKVAGQNHKNAKQNGGRPAEWQLGSWHKKIYLVIEKAEYTCPSGKYAMHKQSVKKPVLVKEITVLRDYSLRIKILFPCECEFMWKQYNRETCRTSLWLELVPEMRRDIVDYELINKYCR